MAVADEEPLRKPATMHEIGCDLSKLSVEELHERVAALKAEVERLEAVLRSKQASRNAADTFFRR